MPRHNPEPVVFQIGFNRCGTKFLSSLFEINGYIARHWHGGKIAENIAASKLRGLEPLRNWPNAHFFSDMESVHRLEQPMIESFKDYIFLHECFPEAIFILNERNVEEWIASRFYFQDGKYRRFHAQHLGVEECELPEIWLRDWETHIESCVSYFGASKNFIRFNLDTDTPQLLCQSLSEWYRLERVPFFPTKKRQKMRRQRLDELWSALESSKHTTKVSRSAMDPDFAESVAKFCLSKPAQEGPVLSKSEMSRLYAEWNGGALVTDRVGQHMALEMDAPLPKGRFFRDPSIAKLNRVQGLINECLDLGIRRSLAIDMQDARRYGSESIPPPGHPVITYNRRAGAPNLTLWPLPGYHTPGREQYVHEFPIDTIAFEEKLDLVAWRGNLTGRPWPELVRDPLHALRPSHKIIPDIINNHLNGKKNDAVLQELKGISRFIFLDRFIEHPDFDIGFTLTKRHSLAKEADILKALCRSRRSTRWFFQHRYLVSLSGLDTGSNFLMAVNSNSVVLKEEDGWELFYTGCFNSWEHYIPLQLGALDVEEKLEWARTNPERCKEMVAASQAVCSKLANPANRERYLRLILEEHDVNS